MQEFKGTKGNWKIGNHFSNIVTDEKTLRPTYNEKDYESEKRYYGGYIVCESLNKRADANLIANAPKLLDALQSAYRCSGERNYLTKPVLDEMLDAINRALGNEG